MTITFVCKIKSGIIVCTEGRIEKDQKFLSTNQIVFSIKKIEHVIGQISKSVLRTNILLEHNDLYLPKEGDKFFTK